MLHVNFPLALVSGLSWHGSPQPAQFCLGRKQWHCCVESEVAGGGRGMDALDLESGPPFYPVTSERVSGRMCRFGELTEESLALNQSGCQAVGHWAKIRK